ncbi:hypothetical protein TKK_0009880 [Trichogramma kaykai]
MEDVQEKISDFLNKHQINASDEQVKLFLNQFNCDSKNFSYLSDMKSQINNLKRKYTFIDPLDIPVGKRMKVVEDEKQNAKSLTKHIEIPYVSITEIIKLVFSKDEVIKSKNNDTPEDNDILTRFEDGEYFKSHPFFKKYEDGIAIILFYDEFLPNNPIGSKNKQQKVGGFAISFLNLPEHLRDFLGNVHTIVLAKHEDIKEFGIDECLTAFMFDLHKLESDEGVICEIGGKEVTLRATLVGVVADSLAAHEILGFMGPSATYFCRLCLMTQEERKLLPFIDCELRTKEMHESFVKMLGAENESVAGVNRDCILNQSRYFHCTQNFIFDIMHDVLEGQAQTDLKLVISKFIQDGKYNITLNDINNNIKNFNYGPINNKNRPSPIIMTSISDVKIQERAVQTWCLLRIFPFIVSEKVSEDDPYLQHIININKINEIIFASKIPLSCLPYLQELIDGHIEKFQKLFPQEILRNKFMHMRHYSMCIKKNGPLRHLSCFKYEAKHSLFKKYGTLCSNYINISKTMMNIAQMAQCSVWGTDTPNIREKYRYSPNNGLSMKDKDIIQKNFENDVNIDNFKATNSIEIYGKMYKNGLFVVIDSGTSDAYNDMPLFAKIHNIYICEENVFFYCQDFEALYLDKALNAYKIKETPIFKLRKYSCLSDLHALAEWNDYTGQLIDGSVFLLMNDNNLKEIGIKQMGIRLKLLQLIQEANVLNNSEILYTVEPTESVQKLPNNGQLNMFDEQELALQLPENFNENENSKETFSMKTFIQSVKFDFDNWFKSLYVKLGNTPVPLLPFLDGQNCLPTHEMNITIIDKLAHVLVELWQQVNPSLKWYPPPAFQDLMAQELVKRFPILGVSSSQDEIPWLKWTDMLKNKFKNDRKNYLRGEEKKYKKKKDVPDENIVGELDPEKLHLQQVR